MLALGGAAAAWPLLARAQAGVPLVGFLNSGTATSGSGRSFSQGLAEAGFVEGRNVAVEYRFADGRYDRLPELIDELTSRNVAVLAATGGVHTALAAKPVSARLPVVFANGSDPVRFGLVASLNKPGGNMTGVSFFTATLESKRLGLLRELVPAAERFGALINPGNANAEAQLQDVEQGGRLLGRPVSIVKATDEQQIEAAFAAFSQQRIDALLVAADPFFFGRREVIVALAAKYR